MKTKTGSMSMANRHKATSSSASRSEEVADFHTLSELAGLNIPPHTMRVLLELLRSGIPPATVYTLLRHIASKTTKLHSQSGLPHNSHTSHSKHSN